MAIHECDVAVIGAGTAGLSAERAARGGGARTLLIDPEFAGTMCANVGCMPSKLVIAAAEAAHDARNAGTFGIRTGEVTVDGPAVMERVRALRDDFAEATRGSFDDLPEGTCLKARARFTGQTTLALDNGDIVEARAVVIATGSYPMIPPPFEGLGDLALTNQTIFEQEDLPKSLAVIGGGAIGLEMAQAMARLGVEVALFDTEVGIGGAQDAEIQSAIQDHMGQSMTLHLGVTPKAGRDGEAVRLTWTGESAGEARFDKVLIATGRPPCLDGLDLEKTGLTLDDNGVPEFDMRTLQCGDAPIFIAGDVSSSRPVLHEASEEGSIAGRNAISYPAIVIHPRLPQFTVTFTDPPIAKVGNDPAEESLIGIASYESQGRARVENRAVGLVKIYAEPSRGEIIGADLFCPGADHMAHFLMAAVMHGRTAHDLAEVPFYHPTLEEGLSNALKEVCRQTPAATQGRWQRGTPPGG